MGDPAQEETGRQYGPSEHPPWTASKRFSSCTQETLQPSPQTPPKQTHGTEQCPPWNGSDMQTLHEWEEVTYCDASRIVKRNATTRTNETHLGAAVWHHNSGDPKATLIDPGHAAEGDTVNHAELCALHGAIEQAAPDQEIIIASDCAAALCQIRKAILHPAQIRLHRHAELLERIVALIQARSDKQHTPITLVKVRAHSGCVGNEMADIAAKRAAQSKVGHDVVIAPVGRAQRDHTYWLHTRPKPEPAHQNTATNPRPLSPPPRPAQRRRTIPDTATVHTDRDQTCTHTRPLGNMQDALRTHMHALHRTGTSNTDTVYYASWQKLQAHIHGQLSNSFLTHATVPHGARRTALAIRMGVIWSAKRAQMMGLRTDNMCPLCGQADGASHIASGCQHDDMRRMYTARHNAAGRQILSSISKGSMGGYISTADVGREELCTADGAPHMHTNHITDQLLPPHRGATQQERAKHHANLRKLKPDIMLVQPHKDPQNPRKQIA